MATDYGYSHIATKVRGQMFRKGSTVFEDDQIDVVGNVIIDTGTEKLAYRIPTGSTAADIAKWCGAEDEFEVEPVYEGTAGAAEWRYVR